MCKHLSIPILIAAIMFAALTFVTPTMAMAQTQTIVCVDADSNNTSSPSGGNPGDDWGNTAYKYLQNGIQRASDLLAANPSTPVQIWVADGTYKPTTGTSRTATFVMRSDVGIYGGFVGNEPLNNTGFQSRDPVANVTILSGAINQATPV